MCEANTQTTSQCHLGIAVFLAVYCFGFRGSTLGIKIQTAAIAMIANDAPMINAG
jgi:hypothetical protein